MSIGIVCIVEKYQTPPPKWQILPLNLAAACKTCSIATESSDYSLFYQQKIPAVLHDFRQQGFVIQHPDILRLLCAAPG